MRYLFILLVGLFFLLSCASQPPEANGQTEIELKSILEKSFAGDADAQLRLGARYDFGVGVPENDVEAVKWYRKAAAQGHAGSQHHLGLSYAMGEGVPQDFVEAYAWLNIAAAQGNKKAIEARDICKKILDSDSLAKAQERSREYFKKYVFPFQ